MKTKLKVGVMVKRLAQIEANWKKVDAELSRMKARCDALCHVNPEQVEAYKERMIPLLERWMALDSARDVVRQKIAEVVHVDRTA